MTDRIPNLRSIPDAIEMFYAKMTLTGDDISRLFAPEKGKQLSTATIDRLKKIVREYQAEHGIPLRNPRRVNTDAAYEAWGIDIRDLENRYTHLRKLRK